MQPFLVLKVIRSGTQNVKRDTMVLLPRTWLININHVSSLISRPCLPVLNQVLAKLFRPIAVSCQEKYDVDLLQSEKRWLWLVHDCKRGVVWRGQKWKKAKQNKIKSRKIMGVSGKANTL